MPSISSAALSQQAALLRVTSSANSATAPNLLSLSNRLPASLAARQGETSPLSLPAQSAVQKTQETAETSSLSLNEASDNLAKMAELISIARGNTSAGDKDRINQELSQLKENLNTLSKSTSVNGQNLLYASAGSSGTETLVTSAGTGADGANSIKTVKVADLGTVLVSDRNASEGVLTQSYSGTTTGGQSYSYHLLSSADGSQSSREISISASTTDQELEGMLSAVKSMLDGVSAAKTKLSAVAEEAGASDRAAIAELVKQSSGTTSDVLSSDRTALVNLASSARDQLQASMLSIANANSNVIAALRG